MEEFLKEYCVASALSTHGGPRARAEEIPNECLEKISDEVLGELFEEVHGKLWTLDNFKKNLERISKILYVAIS